MIVRLVCFVAANFPHNSRRKKPHKSVFNGIVMIFIGRFCLFLQKSYSPIYRNIDIYRKGTFPFSPVHSKDSVGFNLIKAFRIIPVHLIGGSFFSHSSILTFRNNTLGFDGTFSHVKIVNSRTIFRILRSSFCDDVLSTGNSIHKGLNVEGRIFIVSLNEFLGFGFNGSVIVLTFHKVRQRFKPFFYGHHTTSLLLFLERSPQIFQFRQSFSSHNSIVKAVRQFTLGKNPPNNFQPPFFKVFIGFKFVVTLSHFNFVKIVGFILAITGNKGNCTVFVD